MFVCTIADGMVMCFPDVCKTPFPPAPPVPIPYPNIAQLQMAMPMSTKVFVAGAPALFKTSKIDLTQGDNAGVAGGLMSGSFMQKCEFTLGSLMVSFEGKPALLLMSPATGNKANAFGSVMTPSQTLVDAAG
jgi:hypothetical protein